MSRKLDILQKERWQPAQCHAGRDCTQARHRLLAVVATAQQFAFSSQLFSAHSEIYGIPHPSIMIFIALSPEVRELESIGLYVTGNIDFLNLEPKYCVPICAFFC